MKLFSTIKDNPLLSFLIALLVLAFGAFVGVLFCECIETYISKLLGLSDKNEALKFLGIGMGSVLVALQALMSYRRAKAMEDAVEKTEQGQRQDRLKNAIEHLGHDKESVRLGGAYELFHLAKDTLKEDTKEKLSQTVLDILCAHIRQTTGESKYREEHKSKPSQEIQSLLTLLFVQKHEVFKDCHINLQGSWLNGVNLEEARLEEAVLIWARLQKAILRKARLQGANLSLARLQGANLSLARLQGANLSLARLQGANLSLARLQGANLSLARLQGANLSLARLQGAILNGTYQQGANLHGAQLQAAKLLGAHLQGAYCQEKHYPFLSFEQRINQGIGRNADLSKVIFSGGLNQKDVNSLVEGMYDEKANELRESLRPHIDQPESNQPPEYSGAITGPYTKEEAEQWITEYEEATSEVSKDDS